MIEIKLLSAGGEYMDSATVAEWLVQLGTVVKAGDPIVLVETAKAMTEIESPADGILQKIIVNVDEEVDVGDVLGLLGDGSDVAAYSETSEPAKTEQLVAEKVTTVSTVGREAGERIFSTPLARRVAKNCGVDLQTVQGSGPNGRIKHCDIERANELAVQVAGVNVEQVSCVPTTVSAPVQTVKSVVEKGYRRAMASQMMKTLDIPQFKVSFDCDGTNLLETRRRIKAVAGKATVNDLIILGVARTLKKHPGINALWTSKGIIQQPDVNIGVAMATSLGLVVPVIHNADQLSVGEVAEKVGTLRNNAENYTLGAQHISGAAFTISNLGAYGTAEFTAIVNPPQAAILAVPAFKNQVVFESGRIEAKPIARLSVAADHRVTDGAAVAEFMRDLCHELETGDFGL